MTSLAPATEYTVNVYAIRNQEKSAPATTDFTTGEMQSQSTITSAVAPPVGHEIQLHSFTEKFKWEILLYMCSVLHIYIYIYMQNT